tara:strand:- start:276 stop:857 length:582 start_codon:yes stop_codon:yes gene_type:complete
MFNIQDLVGSKHRISRHLQQRGVADVIEDLVADLIITRHSGTPARSKRSIEDVMVGDTTYVDIKTRDINADFSMPNLISIERLRKLYTNPLNELVIIFVDYEIVTEENDQAIYTQERYVIIRSVEIRPIETISWDNLHIQALGKGQLQLKDAHDPIKQYPYDRQEWMGTLKWAALDFIDKQQAKLCKYRQNWV